MEKLKGKTRVEQGLNKPSIRFPEFNDDWQIKPMQEIFTEITEKIGDRKIETYSITAGVGFISQKEKFGRDISGKQNSNYILLKPNEFAYNKGASKTFKYGCVYLNNTGKEVAVPHVFISFKLTDGNMSGSFFQKIFEKHHLDKELKKLIASTARIDGLLNINKASFFKIKISCPSLPEQKRIASFLTVVDKKIAELKQKKALLEQYKKGVMQKLFSQELRFKDDNGKEFPKWEKKKLGEVAEIKTGNKDTQNRIDNGIYPFYVRSNTIERINTYSYDGEAILTSGDGVGVGKNFHYVNGKFDFHQRVYSIRNFTEEIYGKYIFYFFSTFFYDRVKRMSAKNSVDSVRMEMISEMKMYCPVLKEQIKIANFLSTIDDKINRTENQIQHTQEWKKGLLQNMFL